MVIKVSGKPARFGYALDKGTLTITGKDLVPAGRFLKSYNISGVWERFKTTLK